MKEKVSQAFILAFWGILLICADPAASCAERIYYKDGRLGEGAILYRSKGTIWIAQPGGAVGIPMYTISRIEDDDGTVSKFDYESVSSLIRRLIEQKLYFRAAELCDRLVQLFPEYAPGRALRAALNQKLNNNNAAAKDYDYLIKHDMADALIYNDRGAIFAEESEFSRAKECFLEAVKRTPGMSAVHQNLADTYMKLKDFNAAIAEYEKMIELEPSNSAAMYNLGVAYQYIGNAAKARSAWEKVLLIDPQDLDAQMALKNSAGRPSEQPVQEASSLTKRGAGEE
jgi:tetratricopeptide (TPR) repeat protein